MDEPPAARQSTTLCFVSILWKHRLLVVAGSVLPALLLTLAMHLMPIRYAMTLRYKRPLPDSEYRALLDKFYSKENLGTIAAHLREKGMADYAGRLEQAGPRRSLERLTCFRVSSARPKPLPADDPTVSQRPEPGEPRLLDVTITGWSQDDLPGIADTVAGSVEAALAIHDAGDAVQTRLGQPLVARPIPKRVVQRGALALLVMLMVTAFLAVAIEYRKERAGLGRPGAGV